MLKVNKKKLKPYGDRLDDGAMQLSFTLPVNACPDAKEAARRYVEKLGLKDVSIAVMESMGDGFSYFVAYGNAKHTIDITKIHVPKVEVPVMHFEELRSYMDSHLDRPLVVIGAATGSDAHTVGIDAIMNMKGYAHDYGLERYPLFKAVNLRSQLTNQQLLDKAVELKADAILISQVVTQRDSHIKNLKEFRDIWKKDKRIPKETLVIIGGPRLDHAHALKLGFDAGFGPGTKPSFVASFIVREYMKRHGVKEKAPEKKESKAKSGGPRTTKPSYAGGRSRHVLGGAKPKAGTRPHRVAAEEKPKAHKHPARHAEAKRPEHAKHPARHAEAKRPEHAKHPARHAEAKKPEHAKHPEGHAEAKKPEHAKHPEGHAETKNPDAKKRTRRGNRGGRRRRKPRSTGQSE